MANSLHSRDGVMHLQKIKMATGPSSSAPLRDTLPPTSSLPQEKATRAGSSGDRAVQDVPGNARSASQISDDFRPDFDDDNSEEPPPTANVRPVSEYAASFQAFRDEKNKENLAVRKPTKKRTIFDSQPDAQSVHWDSQDTVPEPSSKRRRLHAEAEEEEEEEESVDEDFEVDTRVPDPKRRRDPLPQRRRPVEVPGPSDRMRTHQDSSQRTEVGGTAQRRQERARSAELATPRGFARNNSEARRRVEAVEEEEAPPSSTHPQRGNAARRARSYDSDEDSSAPTSTRITAVLPSSQMTAIALTERKKHKATMNKGPPKRRVPWSQADTELLVELIENYGAAWSLIESMGKWEYKRDQIALKDKARNLKVGWLK